MSKRRSEKILFVNKTARNSANDSDYIACWKNDPANNQSQKRTDECQEIIEAYKRNLEDRRKTK